MLFSLFFLNDFVSAVKFILGIQSLLEYSDKKMDLFQTLHNTKKSNFNCINNNCIYNGDKKKEERERKVVFRQGKM